MSEPEEAHAGHHKRRKGKWVLYQRYIGRFAIGFEKKWFKVRSYETAELAEENKRRRQAKWSDLWEFKVEFKE